MNILYELYENMPRQGPGTDESTARAYSILRQLPERPSILDIGCGSGTQTLALARRSFGSVTALDLYRPFLDVLQKQALAEGLGNKIETVEGSMFDLPFADGSFHLLWSEGAIYIMGFEEGIRAWDRVLKPGGYMVVSEICWLKKHPPRELADFWSNVYPGMRSVEENAEIVQKCGYSLNGFFTLPDEGWWENFYLHLQSRVNALREKYAGNEDVLAVLDTEEKEIAYYQRYKEWYGYIFFIMKKP